MTITAIPITPLHGTLGRGTLIPSSDLSQRIFVNASDGFAIAGVLAQGTYPTATVNGGKTWRVDGPILHADAAQAPFVVLHVGAGNAHTYFAWGSQVADVTSNGGKRWWRAILGLDVLAVVSEAGRLIATVQNPSVSNSATVETSVYVSTDGGKVWHFNSTLGGF
jgi:hypothetical protein